MELIKEQLDHIANLARLDLTDAEKERFQGQLSDVLEHFNTLQQVAVDNVEACAQVSGLVNVWREDDVKDCDESERELALKSASNIENKYFKTASAIEK